MNEQFSSGKETPKLNTIEKSALGSWLEWFKEQAMKNKVNLNHLIRQNKQILKDSLRHAIYIMPELFEFDNKNFFFRQELKKMW